MLQVQEVGVPEGGGGYRYWLFIVLLKQRAAGNEHFYLLFLCTCIFEAFTWPNKVRVLWG